jgi:hypothetical protein
MEEEEEDIPPILKGEVETAIKHLKTIGLLEKRESSMNA